MDRPGADRASAVAEIARLLPQRNGQLGRLLWRHARGPLHRGMASVLATLGDGSQTISGLAEREGIAQPTLTRMVERLETEGLVRRRRRRAGRPCRPRRPDPGGDGRARRAARALPRCVAGAALGPLGRTAPGSPRCERRARRPDRGAAGRLIRSSRRRGRERFFSQLRPERPRRAPTCRRPAGTGRRARRAGRGSTRAR